MTGRVVIVGGGVLGTMHAVEARARGWEVTQLEADAAPRSATVRNFGMVWVSGRAPGVELDAALRARARWEDLAAQVPGLGFRPAGSLTPVTTEAHRAVLEEVCSRPDASARGVELLDAGEARRRNPLLGGRFLAALWCARDAVVEPGEVLGALRAHLGAGPGYRWCPARAAVAIDAGRVVDHTGEVHAGDAVIVCPGARTHGAVAELVAGAPIRPVRLQMARSAPLGAELPTMLADEDSLRYYPAFDVPARAALPPADPLVAEFHMQLLVSQRLDGSLTVGDTHAYDQPFAFELDERPYAHLWCRLAELFGREPPALRLRWSGVYSQCLDPTALCWRDRPVAGVVVVTGPGGRGMTLAPALAEDTWTMLEDGP